MDIETTPELVSQVYKKLEENISKYRKMVNSPLTLAEKILVGHLDNIETAKPELGKSYVFLRPDRAALRRRAGCDPGPRGGADPSRYPRMRSR